MNTKQRLKQLVEARNGLIVPGAFNALSAKVPQLEGVVSAPWPYFWNAWLEK